MEVLVIAGLNGDGNWDSAESVSGTVYIGVDRNHDLSWYISGDDYVDQTLPVESVKYGYEWGGYNIETGVRDTTIGTGLANTNALIAMALEPETEGWYVIWDKVDEFRGKHLHNWFVPSKDELNLVYENKANLSNISTASGLYWSSSERASGFAWNQHFNSGAQFDATGKANRTSRVRLCVWFMPGDTD